MPTRMLRYTSDFPRSFRDTIEEEVLPHFPIHVLDKPIALTTAVETPYIGAFRRRRNSPFDLLIMNQPAMERRNVSVAELVAHELGHAAHYAYKSGHRPSPSTFTYATPDRVQRAATFRDVRSRARRRARTLHELDQSRFLRTEAFANRFAAQTGATVDEEGQIVDKSNYAALVKKLLKLPDDAPHEETVEILRQMGGLPLITGRYGGTVPTAQELIDDYLAGAETLPWQGAIRLDDAIHRSLRASLNPRSTVFIRHRMR